MGTNFYWRDPDALGIPDTLQVRDHIGKRAAAGWYCWDCHAPLVEGGKDMVHTGTARRLDACPVCNTAKGDNPPQRNAAMIELGFAEASDTEPPHGVSTASSFSFAQDPEMVSGLCQLHKREQVIEDEYGRLYTGQEFTDMIVCYCPIRFFHSIGVDFC